MCGRFSITKSLQEAAALFECKSDENAPPRYNIAPTQPIPVIFQNFEARTLQLMRWGFLPSWVKDPQDFSLIINARSESVLQKPSFKSAIRHRRCIIPATGFYEWHRNGTIKTPYYIKPKDQEVVGYAGIYETYAAANGSEIDTVCFLTTAASKDIAAIHHRMPVVIAPEKADIWLDCVNHSPLDTTFFYDSSQTGFYDIIPVSDRVNSARHDDPSLHNRVGELKPTEKSGKQNLSSDQLTLF